MIILAIDTSTSRLSLAVCEAGRTLAVRSSEPSRRQAEVVLPEIGKLLQEAGLQPRQLGGLAVGLGPGSFTGLRVGVAAMQGMAQALGLPVAGVSSFLAAAAGSCSSLALVLEDARREMVYATVYAREQNGWTSLLPESLLSLPDLILHLPPQPLAVTGPGAAKFYPALLEGGAGPMTLVEPPVCYPQAELIAGLAEPYLAVGGTRPEDLLPLYIRRTQAEETLQAAK